jgi:predicted RNA-binding protein with TRAM domain
MELPDDLLALYSAEIDVIDGSPAIAVPDRELEIGDLAAGDRYRVAILPAREDAASDDDTTTTDSSSTESTQPGRSTNGDRAGRRVDPNSPPVSEGEVCQVEIEDVGDQGDGIARIGPGYVVFVPETTIGDRVTAKITQARENFAFAEVVEGEPLSD